MLFIRTVEKVAFRYFSRKINECKELIINDLYILIIFSQLLANGGGFNATFCRFA